MRIASYAIPSADMSPFPLTTPSLFKKAQSLPVVLHGVEIESGHREQIDVNLISVCGAGGRQGDIFERSRRPRRGVCVPTHLHLRDDSFPGLADLMCDFSRHFLKLLQFLSCVRPGLR